MSRESDLRVGVMLLIPQHRASWADAICTLLDASAAGYRRYDVDDDIVVEVAPDGRQLALDRLEVLAR